MAWWPFSKQKSPPAPTLEESEATARQELLERVYAFLSDESLQNQKMPQWLREEVLRAPDVDEVPGGSGEFGRGVHNPIPANGPFGEAQYLSSLVTTAGQPVAFQRLGSEGRIDVYETV